MRRTLPPSSRKLSSLTYFVFQSFGSRSRWSAFRPDMARTASSARPTFRLAASTLAWALMRSASAVAASALAVSTPFTLRCTARRAARHRTLSSSDLHSISGGGRFFRGLEFLDPFGRPLFLGRRFCGILDPRASAAAPAPAPPADACCCCCCCFQISSAFAGRVLGPETEADDAALLLAVVADAEATVAADGYTGVTDPAPACACRVRDPVGVVAAPLLFAAAPPFGPSAAAAAAAADADISWNLSYLQGLCSALCSLLYR
mmetsp:Transcript_21268/g.45923  ORF Transcript_21268/g.45923 Transcript_21268/m.45923 type:complete len:262 (+) Transcript_21268:1885-2670(+)